MKPGMTNMDQPSPMGSPMGSIYLSGVVTIGNVPLGGSNPIRIQSMTNTDTLDTHASVSQCIRIIEARADYVRLTAQGVREAENLANIKAELRKAGFTTPLIADIHFNPLAAETAARIVEKVRINPGNYADKRASFEKQELSENEYNEELERTHAKLLPLINICHENNTVIRVGINHGSLSDRIMSRFGNTPSGMVISAMEFIQIFRAENFNDLVLSMKSSDTSVMIEATRMLVRKMQSEGLSYPVHLGVTEAGEGEDGRVRSAAGIGALLSEGIGDTIRVSLSEEPEHEIPVARKLAEYYPRGLSFSRPLKPVTYNPICKKPDLVRNIPGPLVIADLRSYKYTDSNLLRNAGFSINDDKGSAIKNDGSADFVLATEMPGNNPDNVPVIVPYNSWISNRENTTLLPLFTHLYYYEDTVKSGILNFLIIDNPGFNIEHLERANCVNTMIIFSFDPEKDKYAADKFLISLEDNKLEFNIILNPVFNEDNIEDLRIKASSLLGRYITDRNITGISIQNHGNIPGIEITALCFSILQATEARITRTLYLSCPTCGRTKFNLQESVRKVKEATGHLKGLKIAVMGCVVNGPGEMAGADYGYVGAAPGKVHIYKGTVPVVKNVPEEKAVEELLKVIEKDRLE
jgi:(E)-4-hydroxy-3-methylbut-2-enyl-diphosphate synthase